MSAAAVILHNGTVPGTPSASYMALYPNSGDSKWHSLDSSGNDIVLGSSVFPMDINGYLPSSIAGTNTTASLTVSAGAAADSTGVTTIIKASTTAWAVSAGNAIGGFSGGTTLPNSSTIHFFMCSGTSGVGVFASTSLTPTFPTGYTTATRRIFSLWTTTGGALEPVNAIEIGGGATLNWLVTQTLDVGVSSLGATRALYTLSVPEGIKVQPIIRANMTTTTNAILLTSGDETDAAPNAYGGYATAPGDDMWNASASLGPGFSGIITTNTSGQIGARSTAASTGLYLVTRGFVDYRRS